VGIGRHDLTPAAFIDRDGVINHAEIRNGKPYPPGSIDGVRLCDGVAEALVALRGAGFETIVVTNQPDVGAGRQAREVLESIHAHLLRTLALDDIRVCYHVDADECSCRKPKPGMLLAAAAERGIDLGRSFMIGDRWRDIDAGHAVGCRTVLVGRGYEERPAEGFDVQVGSLLDASRWILRQPRH
jgi:D-glycero-D-manno-heptose 1,7-bisphosphate phosphatase